MSARHATVALVLALASFAGGSIVGDSAAAPRWKAWLCKPGLKINYCNTYLSLTTYASDGVAMKIVVADTPNRRSIASTSIRP